MSEPIPFIKMHGLGNDYVFLDAVTHPRLAALDLPALAIAVSDRRRGVGSDGLILIGPPETPDADLRMRIFNADGSEAEMCGNGVRCVARHARDALGVAGPAVRVEVGLAARRVLSITTRAERGATRSAAVDMGPPSFDPAALPFLPDRAAASRPAGAATEYRLDAAGAPYWLIPVCVGNPHAVIFLPPSAGRAEEIARIGPILERHHAFPNRANIHLAEARGPRAAAMWTWERGAGLTMACGTGACAVLAAGAASGRLARSATLTLPGGDLLVDWAESGSILKTGPADLAFTGLWPA